MILFITDLDRTLLPNGPYKDDGSIPELFEKLEKLPHTLVYATGRNLSMVQDAIHTWDIPVPDFLIAEVGTSLYRKSGNELVIDNRWHDYILSTQKNWNREHILSSIDMHSTLTLQESEKQNEFKISYYLSDHNKKDITLKEISTALSVNEITANILWSVDPLADNVGLIDIIPKVATKAGAVEFLRTQEGFQKEQTIYCGDSGNDILPLTSCYKSILVKNTPDDVKKTVLKLASEAKCTDSVYIANGTDLRNGNYASGIIEGLIHFNIIPSKK